MILQRLAAAIRRQDWSVLFIEFVVLVAGIFGGLQVDRWNEKRNLEERGNRVIAAIQDDLRDRMFVEATFIEQMITGLSDWKKARSQGEMPPPFYFRVQGAETPPNDIWNAIANDGLTELMHPSLVFDLGFYYSESMGNALRYVRYAQFTEADVLPWIGDRDETRHFYREDGTLRPRFRGHMDRAAEYAAALGIMRDWGACLLERLEAPQDASVNCREDAFSESL